MVHIMTSNTANRVRVAESAPHILSHLLVRVHDKTEICLSLHTAYTLNWVVIRASYPRNLHKSKEYKKSNENGIKVLLVYKTTAFDGRVWKPWPSCRKSWACYSAYLYLFKRVEDTYFFYSYITRYVKCCPQLKFVQSFAYLWLSNFPFKRGMKATAAKGIYFGHFVKKWWYFMIRAFGIGCKKVFILYHYYMQKLFLFPIILLFHPNNEDRQDLNIGYLNENNGKQKHWKGLNLTITSNTSMMTSINGKSYQISYRFGVLNDCFVSSPEPLGPFSRFGSFHLVYSIFRICRSSLFGWKRRIVRT